MIWWLILIGYVAVWLLYGWKLSIYLLDQCVRRQLSDRLYPKSAKEEAAFWRDTYLMAGFGLALFWPLVAPIRGAYRLIAGRNLMMTPIEREQAQELELKKLRQLATEYGLPLDGEARR